MSEMPKEIRKKRRPPHVLLDSTRGQLLVMLCAGSQTVFDLAQALGLTNNAVRAQLQRLERDGLVAKAGSRRGVRRPHVEYHLTPDGLELFPKAYEPVLIELLNVLTDRLPGDATRAVLVETGHRLLREHLGELRGGSPRQRLADAVKKLNGRSHGVALNEEGGSTTVRSCSCPIAAVTAVHPEVCGMLASVLTEVLGARVSEVCEKGPQPRCRFEVKVAPLSPAG
jgi:predicted ArsR family transcriptional regulator